MATNVDTHPGVMRQVFSLPVIVAALGYFVDIYDLVLFSIVRVPSLKGIGLTGQELIDKGVFLLNMQMAGMLDSSAPTSGPPWPPPFPTSCAA